MPKKKAVEEEKIEEVVSQKEAKKTTKAACKKATDTGQKCAPLKTTPEV